MSVTAAPASTTRARAIAIALRGTGAWLSVAHWRYGWCWSIALAILACAATVEIATNRPLRVQLSAVKHDAAEASRAASPTVPSRLPTDSATRAREIEAMLRGQGSFETQYQRLIGIAARRGIELPRAEYVTIADESGGMLRVQVSLSIAARYPQFRSFMEEVLRTLPAASLDQFSVKRDNIAQPRVEVLVRMSFWAIREPAMTPKPAPMPQRGARPAQS